ncbi:MAG: hypothetical protein H3Z53_11895 [archaeon]|nr:hypothetical protein [archaeon]MCP8315049.1 hypothetical protein [archaeon]
MTKKELLEDSEIRAWFNELSEKNKETADTYLSVLNIMNDAGINPRTITEESVQSIKYWLMEKFKSLMPKTKNLYLNAIRSWLIHKKIKAELKMKIANSISTPTLDNEKVPEKHGVRNVLLSLSVRARAIVALIAFAGLRFKTQSRITLNDIIDLDIEKLETERTPALIHIPPHASKNRRRYFTFLVEEGCEYLLAYLKERRAKGEILTEKSPVIATLDGKKPLGTIKMRELLGEATHRFLKARPYVLRSYFDSCLFMASIHPRWQSFFMGHSGDIEAIYTVRKQLPPALIENMRKQFEPAIQYLSTQLKPTSIEEQRKRDFIKTAELSGWFSNEELELIRQKLRVRN